MWICSCQHTVDKAVNEDINVYIRKYNHNYMKR